MSPTEDELRQLLAMVRHLPAAERRSVLEARAGDRRLIEEVLALAESEEEPGGSLIPTVAELLGAHPALTATALSQIPIPTIPGLVIERPLGGGGMGWVYLARQREPVERTVAVKMVRATLADPELARRFALEQNALARLNHPAIAQLFSAATTPDGRPYVVMEYVDGPPITEYCKRQRLSVEERLRLFVAVCRGVEHAHRKQLLHRDLKPGNILVTTVDGVPTPKIIDFGIARVLDSPLDDAGLATGARVLGTPNYMSPEALEPTDGPRDLDTRTDVYSLGVVLYELLTGSRPFSSRTGDVASLLRRIAEEDPPRPSTRVRGHDGEAHQGVAEMRPGEERQLARRLHGDLDWITLKALARHREDRYGSAAALADDIERSQRHEPVTARPPSLPDRVLKMVWRHRLAAALATLTLVAMVTAAVLSSLASIRAARAELQAREEAAATRQVLDFLVDLFEAARPEQAQGRDVSARELVALGAERIEEQTLPPLQRARLLHTLAEVQMRLGEYESGRRLAAGALAIRDEHLGDAHPDVLASLDLLGNLQRRSGHLEEAEVTLERLVAAAEENEVDPLGLADALNSLANLRWRQERLGEAEELHGQALALRRSAPGAEESGALDVAASLNNLGVLIWSQGRFAEAEPYLRQAAEAFEGTLGPDHPRVADALGNLGIVLYNLGRLEEDEALQRRALAIREKVLGPDHPDTSAALHNLAVVLAKSGRPDEAEAAYRRSLGIRRRSLGAEHPETLRTLTNLGRLLGEEGRHGEAETLLRQALAIRTRKLGEDHRDVARTLFHLGVLARLAGRPAEAERLLGRALEIQEALDPPRPTHLADTLHELAGVAARRGERSEAAQLYRRALELRREVLPAGHEDVEATRAALAQLAS